MSEHKNAKTLVITLALGLMCWHNSRGPCSQCAVQVCIALGGGLAQFLSVAIWIILPALRFAPRFILCHKTNIYLIRVSKNMIKWVIFLIKSVK